MDTQTPAGGDAGTPGPVPGPGPGPHPGPTPPPAQPGFWAGVRRTGLRRSDERWLGGVAGGLAERVGVDPLVVRGLFAVTFLVGGLGLVLYGVAWALLPDDRDDRILLERLGAGDADGALLGALAFVVVGFARGDGWWWFWDGGSALGGAVWLACVAGLVALVVTAVQRHQRGTAPWQHGDGRPGGPVPPAGPPSTAPFGTAPYGTPYGTPPGAAAAGTPGATAWAQTSTAPLPVGSPQDCPPAQGAPVPPYAVAGHRPPGPPFAGGPPLAPRPGRRGADGATVGAVVGLSVVGLGVLLLAERIGAFDGPVWLTAGGIALVLAGLGIASLAARGRSSGFIGFLAVVGLLVGVPAALAQQSDWADVARGWEDQGRDVTVTSRAVAANGFDVNSGRSRIDLTAVPIDPDEVLRVPINMGAGQLTVIVPREAAVRAHVDHGIGAVRWEMDDDVHEQSGVGLGDLMYEDDDAAAGSPDLVLDIDGGVGQVRIIDEGNAS
ncbi:PspC domain-containing protein [Cellulomonas sp. KH9]|uniref:PspC domain-containing protein n=1 Tax=Cellulomonas sp. KH9 TaxID=1855324 RepID=UPI0008DF838E|nr:PspC domain-containing protein [Cellulomonas sp. KH9]SFJ82343.1 phage shock protein C (PspC) family protein [Cellulomonas sp. KH9]